jgi:hypothetical protein
MSWIQNILIRNTKGAKLTNYISLTETFIPNQSQLKYLEKKLKLNIKTNQATI